MLEKGRWSPADIPWNRFDASKVEPRILSLVRAACLVERNSADYVTYLHRVFADDPAFKEAADQWGIEERQHGDVLGRWAELADPNYDFKDAVARFTAGYRIPIDANASVRGSRSGELIARCVVEAGTSSFYAALGDATEEPVLKAICARIAHDEIRHYRMFAVHMRRYLPVDRLGWPRRTWIAVSRFLEAGDDELSFAYHCGNLADRPYDRVAARNAYAGHAFGCYRWEHLNRAVQLILKAGGLYPHGRLGQAATRLTWWFIRIRHAAVMAP